ncbi:MAG: peptidoglycan-binding protein [Firmicutes bacterium]|nr:peptidoglycan-binding protein [Bacillota bacterium]
MKTGSKGNAVREVQNYLYQLKYLRVFPTGYYGPMTTEAVKSFQLEHQLKSDGIAGPVTISVIRNAFSCRNEAASYTVMKGDSLEGIAEKFGVLAAEIMVKNRLQDTEITENQTLLIPKSNYRLTTSRGGGRGVQQIPWSIVNQLWKVGELARVIDLETGKSFQVRRYGGVYHADSEPLTREDTRIFKEIYGGRWSWERRAVIFECHHLYISASINGMPHGGQSIYGNGFDGQFCIHFLGSRIHQSGQVDSTHQTLIEAAAQAEGLVE